MTHRFASVCLISLIGLVTAPTAHAESAVSKSIYAVVVGNNRSLGVRRPDLHYADDDAVRYYELLHSLAPGNVRLLADFDRDTAQLFAHASDTAVRPSRAELTRIGREMAQLVAADRAAGGDPQFYFVFAGHGDVDRGMGFIELADSQFTAADLEMWLRQIPFARAHVILDACNSFFMLGARKPGGRHFATPEDSARALASRLPNVGVFLSTSAEGESFEWSEIQSGIFSHVVRSGLLGAADANADGTVSYLELAGFVETATADVRNANMRPHIFVRGPFARDDAPIVSLRRRDGGTQFRLSDTSSLRIRLRDSEGVPILDANAEAGARLEFVLPERWAKGAVVERVSPSRPDPRKMALFAVPEHSEPIELASLEPITARGDTRGPAEVFQNLFKRPYGPAALSAYAATRRSRPPEVYGVSQEDTRRMRHQLEEIESSERSQRYIDGMVTIGFGALATVVGASYLQFGGRLGSVSNAQAHTLGAVFLGTSAAGLLAGTYQLTLGRTPGEEAAEEFRSIVDSGGDTVQAFARADARLDQLIARENRQRWVRWISGGTYIVLCGALITAVELSDTDPRTRLDTRLFGGLGALFGGWMLASGFLIESPSRRLTRVWRDDPTSVRFQPVVTASSNSALLGLVGKF